MRCVFVPLKAIALSVRRALKHHGLQPRTGNVYIYIYLHTFEVLTKGSVRVTSPALRFRKCGGYSPQKAESEGKMG